MSATLRTATGADLICVVLLVAALICLLLGVLGLTRARASRDNGITLLVVGAVLGVVYLIWC